MKEELIALANKLEFSGYLSKKWEHNTNEPLRYYFWMCELQKWLRDKYQINIMLSKTWYKRNSDYAYYYLLEPEIESYEGMNTELYDKVLDASTQDIPGDYINDELYDKMIFELKFAFKTYEEALEVALYKALESITIIK